MEPPSEIDNRKRSWLEYLDFMVPQGHPSGNVQRLWGGVKAEDMDLKVLGMEKMGHSVKM